MNLHHNKKERTMTDQHPNVATYVRLMQAYNAGDQATVAQCMSEDVVYHVPGKTPFAGGHVGIDAFRQMLDAIIAAAGGTVKHTPLHILADDRAVMVYSHVTGTRKGKHFDGDVAYLFRFDADGKISEGRTIPVDLYAFDEFWS
jgi:ketosteroid isomerase-like protein